jgi:hypothetical protein
MFYTILDFPLGKIFLAKSEKGLSLASSLKNRSRFEEITEFFKRKSILLELQRKKFHRELHFWNSLSEKSLAGNKKNSLWENANL